MKAWISENPTLATLLCVGVMWLVPLGLVVRQQSEVADLQQDLVQGAYDTCEGQNDLRREQRRSLTDEIRQLQTQIAQQSKIHPSDFPNIDPERFRRLQRQGLAQRQGAIEDKQQARGRLAGRDCEAEFPEATPEPVPKPDDFRRRQQAAQILLTGVAILALSR